MKSHQTTSLFNTIKELANQYIPEGLVIPEHTEKEHYYRHTVVGEKYPSVTTITGIIDSPYLKPYVARVAVVKALELQQVKPGEVIKTNDQIISEAVAKPDELLSDAGSVGTWAHEMLEQYADIMIAGGVPNKQEIINNYFKDKEKDYRAIFAFQGGVKFMEDFNVIPIMSERKVASVKYKFGGTMDLLAFVGDVIEEGTTLEHGKERAWFYAGSGIYEDLNTGRKVKHKLAVVDWKTSNQVLNKNEYVMQAAAYEYCIREMSDRKIKPQKIILVQIDKKEPRYKAYELLKDGAFDAFKGLIDVYYYIKNKQEQRWFPIVKEKNIISLSEIL